MAWFHGSPAALPDGIWLEPGADLGLSNYPCGNSHRVWVTDDPHWAAFWAGAAIEMGGNTGPGFVYEVEPATEPELALTNSGDGPQFHTNRARIIRRAGLGTPGTPHVTEADAWCVVTTDRGVTVVTNSYDDQPDEVTFVSVNAPDGQQLGWWSVDDLADTQRSDGIMTNIWAAVSANTTVWCDDYDVEYEVVVANGRLRACAHGTYVRLIGLDSDSHDDELAYWTSDEWLLEPGFVMGAILGAIASLD